MDGGIVLALGAWWMLFVAFDVVATRRGWTRAIRCVQVLALLKMGMQVLFVLDVLAAFAVIQVLGMDLTLRPHDTARAFVLTFGVGVVYALPITLVAALCQALGGPPARKTPRTLSPRELDEIFE